MAPIYRGDTEVLDGQLKIGNQDVKEVYLGSEKIWPPIPVYPDPVDRFFWKVYGKVNCEDIGLLGSVTSSFIRRGTNPSGTVPNTDSAKHVTNNAMYQDRYFKLGQDAVKKDASQRMYVHGQSTKHVLDMKKWTLLPTDFNCRLKIVSQSIRYDGSGSTYANCYWSTTPTNNRLIIDGERVFEGVCSYPSTGVWDEQAYWLGTEGYEEHTWVSSKTVGEYFAENDGLVEIEFWWAWQQYGSENPGNSKFAWAETGDKIFTEYSFEEISFTTEEPDYENPDYHRCKNLRHLGQMKKDQPIFREDYVLNFGSERCLYQLWDTTTSPTEYPVKADYVGYGCSQNDPSKLCRFIFWTGTDSATAVAVRDQLNLDTLNELYINGVSMDISHIPKRGGWTYFMAPNIVGTATYGVYVDFPDGFDGADSGKYQGACYIGLDP